MANKIAQLIDDPETYMRLGRCAVESVRGGFDVEKLNRELAEELSRLAGLTDSDR